MGWFVNVLDTTGSHVPGSLVGGILGSRPSAFLSKVSFLFFQLLGHVGGEISCTIRISHLNLSICNKQKTPTKQTKPWLKLSLPGCGRANLTIDNGHLELPQLQMGFHESAHLCATIREVFRKFKQNVYCEKAMSGFQGFILFVFVSCFLFLHPSQPLSSVLL